MATPATPALYVTDLKFKLKNTVPEFAGDGTVRYGCYLLAAASVVGYVFMETTAGQGDRRGCSAVDGSVAEGAVQASDVL
ncbi:hypothetical protein pipiens_009102 [Culex pipiens pipiens]|uniref:Uncharacterized protein n=1 Tax=Culex pipiens pipiens TaxID=38569 RepID=A0ABD1DF18_CULPP